MIPCSRPRHVVLACALAVAMVTSVVTVQPASAGASGTLFGAVVAKRGSETLARAQTRQDAAYGQMPISRVFYTGAPQPWPGNAGHSGRPVVVSFNYPPAGVINGDYDAEIANWFATAPTTYAVYWSYIHEPEDNIERGEFTAQQYRDALTRVATLAAPAALTHPFLRATLILMCWTIGPKSGRDWNRYHPPGAVQYVAFDCYNYYGRQNKYVTPTQLFQYVLAWGTANPTLPWGIAEVGSIKTTSDSTGSLRAAWLRSVGHYLAGENPTQQKAIFVNYFDVKNTTDYRLLDTPSRAAWNEVVTTY